MNPLVNDLGKELKEEGIKVANQLPGNQGIIDIYKNK